MAREMLTLMEGPFAQQRPGWDVAEGFLARVKGYPP
jgi:hypothetical protein